MPKYDRELIARMLSCYDGGGYTNEAVAEQIHLLCEAENLEADARTVVREVPEGMVLVPREPTEAMVEAGAFEVDYDENSPKDNARNTWLAMLSAASGEKGVG